MSRVKHDVKCPIGWVHIVAETLQELKRKGDSRIFSVGDFVRSLSNGQPFPNPDCFETIPFNFPSTGVSYLGVSYIVFQNTYRYTRQAHFIAFNDEGVVIRELADNLPFIKQHYAPLVTMLGFNDGAEITVADENPSVTHFSEDIDYPPFDLSVRQCK